MVSASYEAYKALKTEEAQLDAEWLIIRKEYIKRIGITDDDYSFANIQRHTQGKPSGFVDDIHAEWMDIKAKQEKVQHALSGFPEEFEARFYSD